MDKLIGLSGPAGCGKDTVAVRLQNCYGYAHHKFAEHLYKAASVMLGMDLTQMSREEKERPFDNPYLSLLGVSPRQFLQKLGTEFGRDMIHPNMWVILMRRRLSVYDLRLDKVVISDVRFENEARMIRDMGGKIWHVRREMERIADSSHPSEAGIRVEPDDVLLPNTGTIGDLYELMKAWFE